MMSMSAFGVAMPRLLFILETVQNKHGLRELHRVDGAIGAAGIALDDLQNACAAEALERLRRLVLLAALREVQGVAEKLAHLDGQRHQVLLAAPNPDEGPVIASRHGNLYLF